jgi:type I restriction enzyme R subunit
LTKATEAFTTPIKKFLTTSIQSHLGLTATPTDVIDHNTFNLFNCEDGVPTFAYSYEEAVNNIPPFLCNFQVMKIKTKFQEEGINKRTVSLEDQKRLILEGKEIEEINYEGNRAGEKKVINKGTNALIVKEFMEECIKDSNGVLPGKNYLLLCKYSTCTKTGTNIRLTLSRIQW